MDETIGGKRLQRLYNGFWFPPSVRAAVLTPDTRYDYLHFKKGEIVPTSDSETVTVRWPCLDLAGWQHAVERLRKNRQQARRDSWPERLSQAMCQVQDLWKQSDPRWQSTLEALAICTGHSAAMLDFALSGLNLASVEELCRAASCRLTRAIKGEFVTLDGLLGRGRFFTDGRWQSLATKILLQLDRYRERPWNLSQKPPGLILGYAAGNVPGTGLLFILLGLITAIGSGSDTAPPVIVVKNSQREPLFTPLVMAALEAVDPALLDTTLVTLWDYTDTALQEYLISQADLVMAAASDETLDNIEQVVMQVSTPSRPIRFHRHGHKVSFSTIGRECLEVDRVDPENGVPLLEMVALLASLDVAFWNQQGCLSSRVHFVEQGYGPGYHSAEVYGLTVVESLRTLDIWLPKGVSRKRYLHNLFDKYQAMAVSGAVQVLSGYDDNLLVVLARRPLTPEQFRETVNDCQERTVIIIPVDDIMEVPGRYLKQVRREHLQTMSVALGIPPFCSPPMRDREGNSRLLRYAEALGKAGVTSIRTVGRGAFPQLAYSWDGLIPLDLMAERKSGYFTTLEFDQPWAQICETYQMVRQRMHKAHSTR